MEDVARELDVTAPALYWHFASKAELFRQLLQETMLNFSTSIESALENKVTPAERLEAIVVAHTRTQLGSADRADQYWQLTYLSMRDKRWLDPTEAEEVRKMIRHYVDIVRRIIQDGMDSGDFKPIDATAAAFSIINMCEFSYLWFRHGGQLTVDDIAGTHALYALRIVGYAGSEGGDLSDRLGPSTEG
jgi:AcrR family transcriptional regulator